MSQVRTADAGQGAGPLDELVVEFAGWLDGQRGLAPVTVQNYCWHAEQFLGWLSPHVLRSMGLLDAGMVTAFMVEFCRDRNVNSAKSMARSVRSFLRFAHATGRTSTGLWGAVPSSSGWHLASLPRSVPAADLEHLLVVAADARRTATGRRDYAILLLLARLGLRRGEVASLKLDDINWRAGGPGRGREGQSGGATAAADSARGSDRGVAGRWAASVRHPLRVHHGQPARPALVARGHRPRGGQRVPERGDRPDRRSPTAAHPGHGHVARRGVAARGGAGSTTPKRQIHRHLRQGRRGRVAALVAALARHRTEGCTCR